MYLGWPLTILLVLAIVLVMIIYAREDRKYRQRKLDIVQEKLAALEAKKRDREARLEANAEQESGPGAADDRDAQS